MPGRGTSSTPARNYDYTLVILTCLTRYMPLRILTVVLTLLAGAGFAACDKGEPPDQRIRALIGNAEQAIEKRSVSEVRGYVSERYADAEGRNRRTVEGILRLYLLRHEAIHLFTRIDSIALAAPHRASAVVYVAMAGRPIASAAQLLDFNANLYRFELGLAEEGNEWRVVSAAWRPAEPADFVYSPPHPAEN